VSGVTIALVASTIVPVKAAGNAYYVILGVNLVVIPAPPVMNPMASNNFSVFCIDSSYSSLALFLSTALLIGFVIGLGENCSAKLYAFF
jgi:hypothetical protein